MRPRLTLLAIAGCLLPALPLHAQPAGPPVILQIFREDVKVGKGSAHETIEAQWPAAFRRAATKNHYLAATTSTGGQEAWFMTAVPDYATLEAYDQEIAKAPGLSAELQRLSAADGEMLSGARTFLAELRPDSGPPGAPLDIGKMRGFVITTYRLRPGHTADWMEMRGALVAAYARAGLEHGTAVYEIVQGVTTPTYMVIRPFRSMAEMDARSANASKVRAAMSMEQRARYDKLTSDAVISREVETLMFNPKMSYAPEGMVASDPAFWTPKPVVAQRPSLVKPAVNVKEPPKP
ncbi:hypothetical protein J421_2424 [Gemmatirosa kalamazoonensis]|jgi:hypothetical protein|uniref:NIPSNAP family containing protein n=1 Tax=Gemmatirosa kalamazoonensis TaxID=861299 RepID=W0RGQ3_9BACT|nr:hypothetical protein [Gemmatirosa kalamazoonensis]AHG89961.1 hypothetical protein J421_2424 [Gemmatirosa kalamazoonensis]